MRVRMLDACGGCDSRDDCRVGCVPHARCTSTAAWDMLAQCAMALTVDAAEARRAAVGEEDEQRAIAAESELCWEAVQAATTAVRLRRATAGASVSDCVESARYALTLGRAQLAYGDARAAATTLAVTHGDVAAAVGHDAHWRAGGAVTALLAALADGLDDARRVVAALDAAGGLLTCRDERPPPLTPTAASAVAACGAAAACADAGAGADAGVVVTMGDGGSSGGAGEWPGGAAGGGGAL